MTSDPNRNATGVVSWLGVLLGTAALVVALTALNRTRLPTERQSTEQIEVLTDQAERTANQADDLGQRAKRLAAQARVAASLVELRKNLQKGTASRGVVAGIESARRDLESAYADAPLDVRKEWQELDGEFKELVEALHERNGRALPILERILIRLNGKMADVTRRND